MELKRTILAVALSMMVLVVWQKYFAPTRTTPVVTESVPAVIPETSVVPSAPVTAVTGAAAVSAPGSELQVAQRHVIENDKVAIEITTREGAIVGAKLKTYSLEAGGAGGPVTVLEGEAGLDFAGATRLEGVPATTDALFVPVEEAADRASYVWQSPEGLRIEKTYRLEPGRYDALLTVKVVNQTSSAVHDRLSFVMAEDFGGKTNRLDRYNFSGPVYFANKDYEEVKLKKLEEGVQAAKVGWAAMLRKYFLVAVVPLEGPVSFHATAYKGLEKVAQVGLASPVFDLAPGAETTFSYRVYLGPKLADELTAVGSDLGQLINYGFFHVIAKPLMVFLQVIYRVTGNYGIAIILLTILIKAVFWPLSAKSYKSMQRMKELQPKMAKLKERYGKDKERLNTEVMQLYKTHKVNPLGGCLPMVVQIPFFFALYRILLGSIELRQAPFMLWITDLSIKDPYYVTPLLMGVTMFLQQRMTPQTGAMEGQMKMMMYGMPIVFTFLFLNFPAGLVIYWLVNNVLSIAQQGMTMRKMKAA